LQCTQSLSLNFQGRPATYEITGVFDNYPENAHLCIDFLTSYKTLGKIQAEEGDTTNSTETSFGWYDFYTYLQLQPGTNLKAFESKLPAYMEQYVNSNANARKADVRMELYLQPLTSIHLYSKLNQEAEVNGEGNSVAVMFLAALFILGIAWINYINLSTARAASRAREIGIRKVVGAYRREIVFQFLGEAMFLSLTAAIMATGLIFIAMPYVNKLLDQDLSLSVSQLGEFTAAAGLLALATGLLAGAYPALFLSGFQPLNILKGDTSGEKSGGATSLRKVLVVSQFSISLVLIKATLVVFRQLEFMQAKSLGLNKEQVVTLNFYGPLAGKYDAFYNELTANPAVKNVARSSRLPSGRLLDSFGQAKLQMGADTLEPTQVDLKFVTIDHRFFPCTTSAWRPAGLWSWAPWPAAWWVIF